MSPALVFDTGPLSHFAEAGWLKILEVLAGDREVLVPEVVSEEIKTATHAYPFFGQVLDSAWIKVDRSNDVDRAGLARIGVGDCEPSERGTLPLDHDRKPVRLQHGSIRTPFTPHADWPTRPRAGRPARLR